MRGALIIAALLSGGTVAAETAPDGGKAVSASLEFLHRFNQTNVIEAAKRMPEEKFDYRPAPQPVRSFGELVAHIADANYLFCSAAAGKPDPIHPKLELPLEQIPEDALERRLRTKTEIVQALEESFAYCGAVFQDLTDESLAAPVERIFGTRAQALILAVYHGGQHYGNLVTYMRVTGVEPPTALATPGGR
jgi:uncharacterized damage-inducible protein DinB